MSAQEVALRGLKRLATFLLGDYSAYFIYQSPDAATAVLPQAETRFVVRELGPEELAASQAEVVHDQAGYLGAQALGFACTENGAVLGLASTGTASVTDNATSGHWRQARQSWCRS